MKKLLDTGEITKTFASGTIAFLTEEETHPHQYQSPFYSTYPAV